MQLLLGHRKLETTVKYYCELEAEEAFRHFDAVLLNLEEPAQQGEALMRKSPHNRRALALENWPDRDRRAWLAAQTNADEDLLAIDKPAVRWRDSSKELFVRYYGIWLAWLDTEGLLDPNVGPGERVTPARLAEFLRAQRKRGSQAKTLVNQAVSLRHMFDALAPSQDWSWTLTIIGRLKTAVVVAKNHSDLPSIKELFDLGVLLMRRAECAQKGSAKQRAVMYRNGLSIAILAARPLMRRQNLATMKIGQHLIKDGPAYRLQFSGDDMKGRRSRGGELPSAFTGWIDRYLETYRPVLFIGKPDNDGAFFISGMGLPIYPHAMSNEIGEITEAFFGRRVTTHEFRHAAASSIAKEDPEHVGIVPSMLGHTQFKTSEQYYIFADEHEAFRRLDRAMSRLMREETGPTGEFCEFRFNPAGVSDLKPAAIPI